MLAAVAASVMWCIMSPCLEHSLSMEHSLSLAGLAWACRCPPAYQSMAVPAEVPRVDVLKEEEQFTLIADLPGFTKKDVDVKVSNVHAPAFAPSLWLAAACCTSAVLNAVEGCLLLLNSAGDRLPMYMMCACLES